MNKISNKNTPRIYWDEDEQYYYITFYEDTECDEIVDSFERFKGRKPKQKKEHDSHTNKSKKQK